MITALEDEANMSNMFGHAGCDKAELVQALSLEVNVPNLM